MTAIEKQIQAAEKRIEKFEKNIKMYNGRADKKIMQLQKHHNISREDFTVEKTGRWKYDYEVKTSENIDRTKLFWALAPVMDDLMKERENTDRLENEKKELEALKQKIENKNKMQEEISVQNEKLFKPLQTALAPFKQTWTEQMINYHQNFYQRIHKMLPNAQKMYHELKEKIDRLYRLNGYRSNAQIKQHESAKASFGRIIAAPPARFNTEKEYMKYIIPELEKEYTNCLWTLADKCRPLNVDTEKVEVFHPRMAERGFDLIIKDGKERVIDARMIWAAEDSEYVAPHTRYIVTERKIKQEKEEDENEIRNITVSANKNGEAFIRCKIDGVQQLAKKMTPEEIDMIKNAPDKKTAEAIKAGLAQKYFHEEKELCMKNGTEQGRKL